MIVKVLASCTFLDKQRYCVNIFVSHHSSSDASGTQGIKNGKVVEPDQMLMHQQF